MSGESAARVGVDPVARDALRAVAAVVGIPVTVTNDDGWHIDERGLRAGLGWYLQRGHSGPEAAALALLQLWEGVRGPRIAPERAGRARLLGKATPHLAPLVAAISRAQAASEVVAVFPGMRPQLIAALIRGLPHDLSSEQRADQWLALILRVGFGISALGAPGGVHQPQLDALVLDEWASAGSFAGSGGTAVRRVLSPDPGRSGLEHLERALALLAPGYERLLARDRQDRGLGGDGATASPHEGGADNDESGAAAEGSEANGAADPEAKDEGDQGASSTEPPAQTRPGDGQDIAEGSDLFQAEQAGEVTAFLDTPLPSAGSMAAAFADLEAGPPEDDAPADGRPPGMAGGLGGHGGSGYLERAESLTQSIERMREVWREVAVERVASVSSWSRTPQAEGERLDVRALATGIAEAHAGVERPRVFLSRELRVRRTERSGNTDYLLLIDRSASMQGRPARAAADTAIVMLEGLAAAARDIEQAESASGLDLELQLRTGLIVFDARAHVVKPLSRGMSDEVRSDLLAAVMTPQGSTNDASALDAAAEQLRGGGSESRQRRRIVFVISDGGTNDQVAATHALRRLRGLGASVYGIGLGNDDISERYAPHGARVDDPELLAQAIGDLIVRSVV